VTTVLLARHGMCDPVGRSIAGREPGIHLNPDGCAQVRALAAALAGLPIVAVYAGPLERALETAAPLAGRLGVEVRMTEDLDEVDYGAWTGRTLTSLAEEPLWQRFNAERGTTRIPGGETMADVAHRARRAMGAIGSAHPEELVLAVTHGDVIRALLASYLGMDLGDMLRLEVAPASVSMVRLSPDPRVLAVSWAPVARAIL
jgi:probable phosphomutase (TIGR03848 family)